MFLNASDRLGILQEIGQNATFVSNAIQRADYGLLCEAVRCSWQLNCRLDRDTNPPQVQQILTAVGDYLAGAKLLGAGGGGYILMLAKDEGAATRIRQRLTENPPNPRARFSRFNVSPTGLEITRS
jgi:galactokinase/mevalonate kinase-like predicted kinase